MITAWDTAHEHSRQVVAPILEGMLRAGEKAQLRNTRSFDGSPIPSLLYGILRGNTEIMRSCARAGVDWWAVDNGFFRPGHYSGYYRIARRSLQPKFSFAAPIDPARWKALGIQIHPWRTSTSKSHVLLCPPTPAMSEFYKISKEKWTQDTVKRVAQVSPRTIRVREKGCPTPLAQDLSGCHCVITFNSNVAMQSLLLGIPAIVDRGTVRDWNNFTVNDVEKDLTSRDRLALFQFAASCQFTLNEFKEGGAWKAIRRILG